MAMKLDRWLERIERDLGVEIVPTAGPVPPDHALDCAHPAGADIGSCRWGIITQDPRMIDLLAILERASSSRLPILILGESGTGKELLARAAHGLSDRAARPFVVGHCAALSDGLLDVELFGKDPGEGPGGEGARTGLFETASRGVMFLDEVGELLTSAQAKLLRVIEMGELRLVGSTLRIILIEPQHGLRGFCQRSHEPQVRPHAEVPERFLQEAHGSPRRSRSSR